MLRRKCIGYDEGQKKKTWKTGTILGDKIVTKNSEFYFVYNVHLGQFSNTLLMFLQCQHRSSLECFPHLLQSINDLVQLSPKVRERVQEISKPQILIYFTDLCNFMSGFCHPRQIVLQSVTKDFFLQIYRREKKKEIINK